RRSVQRHFFRRAQPSHQVHHALRLARRRARGATYCVARERISPRSLGDLLSRVLDLRLPVVLWNAHRLRQGSLTRLRTKGKRRYGETRTPFPPGVRSKSPPKALVPEVKVKTEGVGKLSN